MRDTVLRMRPDAQKLVVECMDFTNSCSWMGSLDSIYSHCLVSMSGCYTELWLRQVPVGDLCHRVPQHLLTLQDMLHMRGDILLLSSLSLSHSLFALPPYLFLYIHTRRRAVYIYIYSIYIYIYIVHCKSKQCRATQKQCTKLFGGPT